MIGARSYLYVPGTDAGRLAKAVGLGADGIVADLEDAVRPADKPLARRTVAEWLHARSSGGGPQLWVRITADQPVQDIDALGDARFDGVFVPKAELDLLAAVDRELTRHEERLGRPTGEVKVIGLLETATGVLDLPAIARAPRIHRLGLGEADLAADLGIARDHASSFGALRLQLVLASAAARIEAPVGPVATDFRDTEKLAATTRDLRAAGYRARTAIHPAQIAVINAAFAPTESEIAQARRLVARLEESAGGIAVDEDGQMLDAAVIRSARATLEAAGLGHEEPAGSGSRGPGIDRSVRLEPEPLERATGDEPGTVALD